MLSEKKNHSFLKEKIAVSISTKDRILAIEDLIIKMDRNNTQNQGRYGLKLFIFSKVTFILQFVDNWEVDYTKQGFLNPISQTLPLLYMGNT